MSERSEAEAAFEFALNATGATVVKAKDYSGREGVIVREYQFARALGRYWQIDFSRPDLLVGLEIDGAVGTLFRQDTAQDPGGNRWSVEQFRAYQASGAEPGKEKIAAGGRHTQSPQKYEDDARKHHTAMVLGWWLARVTPRQVTNGQALDLWDAMVCERKRSIADPLYSPNAGALPWFQPSLFPAR